MSLDSRPTGIDWHGGGGTGTVRFGEDRNLLVMFYNRPVHSGMHAGRPIYKDEIFIKIQHPGEMLNVIDRPVNENDKQRFRQQWANFVHDRTQVPEGTPIDLLFPNHPSVAENLRAMGVFTIEQCSNLSATAIDTIGRGAQEYVNRAQKYLDSANKGHSFHLMQKENDDLRQQLRIQEQQINTLKIQLESLTLKISDPVRASLQPPHMVNVDAQTERINGNSPTRELAETVRRKQPRRAQRIEDKITDPFGGMSNAEGIMGVEGQD